MFRKTAPKTMLMLLLIGVSVLAFNVQPVKSEPKTWTMDDDGPADFLKTRDAVTKSYPADASRASINHWSIPTIKSFFENGLDTRLMDVFQLPFEASGKWDFDNEVKWSDFADVDGDSAELVIGLDDMRPNSYSELKNLVMSNGGKLVNTVSMDGKVVAVMADIAYEAMSIFVSKVEISRLSRYIEPNVRFEVDVVPNDPDWSKQWGPVKIEADWAWNTTIGDPSVLVAVIDTGVDWTHPDLAANYVALGYDWVNNDPNPMDDHGHGTHCAGVIAAAINNNIGMAGLAQVCVMAEKGLNELGSGRSDELANAIVHAVDQGADILSISWGSYTKSTVVHEAVRYAYDHGVLVVAAAGNDATDIKHYPAAYDEVVAVTATDEFDNRATFTNFGDWVEVAAPGVQVYSTVLDDSYAYMSGTSMSAPHVSGVAALIWSQFPSMTRDQVRVQLQCTTDDLGLPGFDVYYGYGRVNVRKAVEQASSDHDLLVLSLKTPSYVILGYPAVVNATILNMGTSDESDITVQLLANGSVVDSKIVGFLVSGASTSVSYSWIPVIGGVYNITSYVVRVIDETIVNNNVLLTQINVRIPQVIKVPEDHDAIHGAVDAAKEGDTILVASGTYYENLWINKEGLTLVGEDVNSTIIQGAEVVVAADNVNVNGFTIQDGNIGIATYCSKGSIINNTRTLNNEIGIYLVNSANIVLINNNMTCNSNNLDVDGYSLSDFIHKVDTSNLVNGKPVCYWVDEHDKQVPSDAGYVAAVNSTNIVIKDLNLTYNGEGVLLVCTSNSIIENVNASSNYDGVYLAHSIDNTVSGCIVTSNYNGVYLYQSKSNNFSHNMLIDNNKGVNSYYSSDNKISFNKVLKNDFGILLQKSQDNIINSNKVSENEYGIYLQKSCYDILRNNNMTCNKYNFGVLGNHLSHFIQDIDTSNTVDGKPVYYWLNQKDEEIPVDAGYVAVVNSTNIAVRGLSLTNNVDGVVFAYTSESLIENVNASNNMHGVHLYSSNNNTIVSNAVTSKSERGIQLISSNNNTICNNMITNNYIGIGLWESAEINVIDENVVSNGTKWGAGLYLDNSGSNSIGNNNIKNSGSGIKLYWSGGNTLRNNSMTSNECNFGVYGVRLLHYVNDVDTSNTVNGKPIYYWINQHDTQVATNAGYVAVVNSTGITAKDLNLSNNEQGVLFAYTTNSTIKNVSATNNMYGIMLQNSDQDNIIANNVENNDEHGIYLHSSCDNTIQSNTATNNYLSGIYLLGSRNNVISNNTSLKNGFGISLQYGSDKNIIEGNKASYGAVGMHLTKSRSNVINENIASNNRFFLGYGVWLEWSSDNNTIVCNTIVDNNYGIMLSFWVLRGLPEQNNNNTIYHNNFISNRFNQIVSYRSINSWDDGYPSGGNYWSDYNGTDVYSGPYQNETGRDGIGDTPYLIDENNQDNYPLMHPYGFGDLNNDGAINIQDLFIFGNAYGSSHSHPRWNPDADLDGNGIINILDGLIIAKNFGKTYQ